MSDYGSDPFGNARGWTDGAGAVDMGDGIHVPTQEYETVRLPDELGGAWVVIIESHLRTLPDGRIGRHHVLAHPEVDAIALLNGDGILWVRKQKNDMTVCNDCNQSITGNGRYCGCTSEQPHTGGEEE